MARCLMCLIMCRFNKGRGRIIDDSRFYVHVTVKYREAMGKPKYEPRATWNGQGAKEDVVYWAE